MKTGFFTSKKIAQDTARKLRKKGHEAHVKQIKRGAYVLAYSYKGKRKR